ncbi:MAG: tetratricopeptide repeat protein [Promethearchaeota archaeon]
MDPNKAAKFRGRAQECMAKNDYDKALEWIYKSLEEHPSNPVSWELQGIIQNKLRLFNDALQSFREAVKLNPDSELSWLMIASLLRQKKDYMGSLETLYNLLQRNPRSQGVHSAVFEMLEKHDYIWDDLFRVQPELLIMTAENLDSSSKKIKLLDLLDQVVKERPELFKGDAFKVVRTLICDDADAVRERAYFLLRALYDANPQIMEKNLNLLRLGLADSNESINRVSGALLRAILDYFPEFIAGDEKLLISALEHPVVAQIILSLMPACPNCNSRDDVYLRNIDTDTKNIYFYCEKCDIDYYKKPGFPNAHKSSRRGQKISGPIICPICNQQFLIFKESEGLYHCSLCNKWYTL